MWLWPQIKTHCWRIGNGGNTYLATFILLWKREKICFTFVKISAFHIHHLFQFCLISFFKRSAVAPFWCRILIFAFPWIKFNTCLKIALKSNLKLFTGRISISVKLIYIHSIKDITLWTITTKAFCSTSKRIK